MPLNWSVEALKWKYINDSNEQYISFKQSFSSVIFGACAGFISPGRWGEPFARAYYLDLKDKGQRVYSNVAGILSQWFIILVAGLLAILYFKIFSLKGSLLLLMIIGSLSFISYLLHDFILERIFSLNWMKKLIKFSPIILRISNEKKIIILLFSLLRFLIFSLQYLILISAFSLYCSQLDILMRVFLLFLFQSFSFFPSILDLGFKGNIALFLFKNHPIVPSKLLLIILIIWAVNLAVPAIYGYFIFYNKIRKLQNSENK